MIIDTCKAIENLIKNCGVGKWIGVKIDSSKSQGKLFHKMEIDYDLEGSHLVERMSKVFKEIGWYNGEGLFIKIEGRTIFLS